MKPLPSIAIFFLLFVLAAYAPVFAQEQKDAEVDGTTVEAASEPDPTPPDIKATVFLRAGGGAAQTTLRFSWVEGGALEPLHDLAIRSSGNATNLSVTAWFYPTDAQGLVVMTELSTAGGSTKIHFSGDGYENVDKKIVDYGGIHALGGVGYRQWVGKRQRYSLTYFGQAGPGVLSLNAEGIIKQAQMAGASMLLGTSIQYHYSTRILFGGIADVGYSAYYCPRHELNNDWAGSEDRVEVQMTTGFFRLQLLLGYDF